jgi:lipid II:glycine glycyltransferase (peptidoglycan interpeptide bridge formation enzyme)
MNSQTITERAVWNRALLALPAPHLLQSWEWGAVKGQTGWAAHRLLWTQPAFGAPAAAASLLLRRINRLPWGVAYVPKGPVLDWDDPAAVELALAGVEAVARQRRAIFVKIDPDVDPASPAGQQLVAALRRRGWQPSPEQIQFRNTALLDLAAGEEALLAGMKPKWRYNIRLAERRGVQVRVGGPDDLLAFYALYAETGGRDGFIVRPFDYYGQTWLRFMQPADGEAPWAALLLAEVEGEAVAGLILFGFGATAWYLYGASSERQRSLMPNHLLQWEAMRLARSRGCATYDLWGAPDVLEESDALWGVWRFKEGFGAQFAPHIGAWDFPVNRPLYRLYSDAMPRVLDWMRGRHQQGDGAPADRPVDG